MTTEKIDLTGEDLDAETRQMIEDGLWRHHGRGGWKIKRVTANSRTWIIHYTDFLAELRYYIAGL